MKIEDYSKYYVQGSDHYLIPKDVFIELFEEMENWKDSCLENAGKIEKLENQQKEFIKFLEDNYKETQDIWYIKLLQKYKSIIGGASNE